MQCPQCGFFNRAGEQVCAQCGSWLPATAEASSPTNTATADQSTPPQSVFGTSPAWPAASYAADSPPFVSGGASYVDAGSPFGGTGVWSAPPASGALVVRQPSGFGVPGLSSMPLELGTLLKGGRYRLLQAFAELGGGSPAENEPPLLTANDTEVPNTRVLVQELPFSNIGAQDAEYTRQLIAQRLVNLSRVPGMARLVDSFTERGRHFLVFELPSGDLLSDRLKRARGRLPEMTAVSIALQLLDLLSEFEREYPPVTHGNIAPSNVVLRPSGQITLVGISPTLLLHPDGHIPYGAAAGVPGYAAPEQARGQASPRSDLYGICALIYAAVTGAPPAMRATALYQPVRRANPDVSIELEEVLSKGLRPSQAQRFADAAEMRAVLRPIASGQHTARPEDDLLDDADPARRLRPVRDARGRLVLPRQSPLQNPLLLAASVIALIVLVGAAVLFALQPGRRTPTTPDAAVMREAAALFQSKGIGLSGGSFIFDTERPDNDLKQQAARALGAGDTHTALGLFAQAATADRADAEAAIYAANIQVTESHSPYVTLVAAVAFASGDQSRRADDARAELQGVYLAQRRANTTNLLPGGAQLRVLVLNSGQDSEDAAVASKLLLDEIDAGNAQRIIGIVGWPGAEETQSAIAALAPSGFAIVSPGASADKLGGSAANFFRTVPSDSSQAAEMADAARLLNARRIAVVSDPNDDLSTTMANRFSERVSGQYTDAMTLVQRINIAAGAANDYAGIVANALGSGADLIYVASDDRDAIPLAAAVARRFGGVANPPLHVLVGPHGDTPAARGLGDNPMADLMRRTPGAPNTLYVATLADTGAWAALDLNNTTGADFESTYATRFKVGQPSIPRPTVILGYDSANLLMTAADKALPASGALPHDLDPTVIRTALRAFDVKRPFVGVGGAIGFTITGSLPRKAIAILRFSADRPAGNGIRADIATVVGGKQLFCGPLGCVGV